MAEVQVFKSNWLEIDNVIMVTDGNVSGQLWPDIDAEPPMTNATSVSTPNETHGVDGIRLDWVFHTLV